ncbi:MAG: acyl-CoA dehydrogenase C-terminal domain-containing protein, partial [Fimbriimonadaceae bacterium]|nr:acyl-CoA dehydrogenase C-terminal domain-containing protein [Alphaproteobacteria bacterium]
QDDMAQALAGATPYLRMFGLTAGAVYLARGALAATAGDGNANAVPGAVATARYFAEYLLPETLGLKGTVMHGGEALLSVTPDQLIG